MSLHRPHTGRQEQSCCQRGPLLQPRGLPEGFCLEAAVPSWYRALVSEHGAGGLCTALGHSRVPSEPQGANGELPPGCASPSMPQSGPRLTFPQHYHLCIPAPHAGSVHGIPAAQPGARRHEPAPRPGSCSFSSRHLLGISARVERGGGVLAGAGAAGPFPGLLLRLGLCPLTGGGVFALRPHEMGSGRYPFLCNGQHRALPGHWTRRQLLPSCGVGA